MRHCPAYLASALLLTPSLFAADNIKSKTTYAKAYGETRNPVSVDPSKDLPRYPAVEAKDAISTWQVKPGFKLQLAAHEPQVRDPIAICYDERGRMFVCEMIDYSEMRDVTPHLGRISVLEDKDGDGYFETSTVFADNLPWPTGLIWANGGLYVGATPDIWRFEDRDGDGRAEVREKVFTGFGTGLKLLNVQGLMNSFQWGPDNRIHVLAGGGNRGVITCLKRPDLPGKELGGRDFWFDPKTHEFGLEVGGAQYGMSFDNYGRKFGCSNSDHLQFWVHDDRYAGRNPLFNVPSARKSIAADGGAAEVFRISPDEPWRIIRTRWRVAGVVRGAVEGGGRVSGYFTGASGTTVYRGDAYGEDFVNNTFSGDAGGQLVHRKKIHADGVSLVGRRPDDEQGFEFAASKDTWVRVVNFANSPDGCLNICDMYREVIEHPWSIPDEIKRHIDLNSGNDRGRIYRLVPDRADWQRRKSVNLADASTAELVKTLAHPNGWHRDTAARLLYERQDKAAVSLVVSLLREPIGGLAKFHALSVLDGLGALDEESLAVALADSDPRVKERAIQLCGKLYTGKDIPDSLTRLLSGLAEDPDDRVRFQLAYTVTGLPQFAKVSAQIAAADHADPWISAALLSGPPDVVANALYQPLTSDSALAKKAASFLAKVIEFRAASQPEARAELINFVAKEPNPVWLRALGDGLSRGRTTLDAVDTERKLATLFTAAATTASDAKAPAAKRLEAIELLSVAGPKVSVPALKACLAAGQPDAVQIAALQTLALRASPEITAAIIEHWANYAEKTKETAVALLLGRQDRTTAFLKAVEAGTIKPTELAASQVQSLIQHKDQNIVALARKALSSVVPPSREEVTAKFQPAIGMKGDATRGQAVFMARCFTCHRAGGQGVEVGPDLVTVKNRGRDGLLTAILDPNKEVASQYIAYVVTTKDGQTLNGIISKDDASSLTVKLMGGAEITIARGNVKGSTSAGQSMMPEGLETGMSVQEMADLLTFIEELK